MHTIDTLNALLRRIPLATMAVVALLALFGALTFAALYSPSVGAQDGATLSALSINDGTSDVDLNPAFTSTGTSYRTAVKYRGDRLTVTATTTSSNATIVFLDRSDGILDDADPNTSGRQVNVPIGGSIFKIKVTAQDGTAMEYEVVVERDSAYLFGWTPTRDLNHLAAAGNDSPQGIWSDGTTMWIADDDDDKLYAYTLATGVRDASKEFSLHNDNGNPKGIWSDGTTIWVADDGDDKLYAYTLSGGARESSKEFSLHTDNDAPWGIWSDGTTIWVTNGADPILYAYTLDNGARQDGTGGTTNMEFRLNGESLNARGIWSDGSTLWVSSSTYSETKPLVAYTLDLLSDGAIGILHGLPDWDKSFYTPGTLQLMGTGIWSDGNTAIWMASTGPAGKIYSFNTLPASASGVSLSSLTINDGANNVELRPAFNSNDVVYWTSVVNDVSVVTVSATASDTAATVEYVNADADTVASGHQVDVVEGTTPIAILVAAADGAALIHFVIVERDSSRFGGWTPTKDIHGLGVAGRALPTGIWSDGDTMWVVYGSHDNLYAYTLDTGVRDASKEFSLHSDNGSPNGLWSDGQTIWVGDPSTPPTLFAYTLKDDTTTTGTDEKGQREPTKDITLEPLNFDVTGIWSNGTDTVWVADGFETRLFAYTLDIGPDGAAGPNHGARKADSDISTLENPGFRRGSWSDGTTLWVGDNTANYFRAYTLDTGEREESKDVPFAPYHLGNTGGIWSDGSTLWTAHQNTKRLPVAYSRIFSHTLPTSGGATTLSNLTVTSSPEVPSFTATLRPTFSPTKDIYRVALPNAAEFMTISPTLSDNAATATYQDKDGGTLVDADTINIGHQVSVPVGAFVINIKITKTGEPSITYTVVVERDSAEPFGWTPSKDLNTFYQDNPEAAGQVPRGVWGDETTLYVAPHNTAKVFAFNRSDGTRNQAKDIVVSSDFPIDGLGRLEPIIFAGIWSDGTTMWVVDYYRVHDEHGMDYEPSTAEQAHGKVFAYRLVDGERDKSKEFVLDSIHQASVRGVWSDGTTVWLSDWKLAKLIAYHLKDTPGTNGNEFGTRYEAKDITLHLDNDSPQGIWSDGTTIWVADWDDDKLYAYELATGVRAESQEFNLIPDNPYPRDVWSDGATMWVPDAGARKMFSYRMPPDGTTTDPPGVTVSPTALTVTEEDTTGDSYTVVLDSQPTADVEVMVAGYSGTAVTPTPSTLTFTSVNWDTSQTVTVKAGADADTENDTVTLTHSAASTDSDYNGNSITIDDVTVTVTDDDIDTAAGICGRTEEVRDALLELIPGVIDCAAVTAADLAAITDTLNLSGQNISVLAAGDFAGLTALTELYLNNNGLTTLPKDVFAGLTSLKVLTLYYNELTTLPDGVFGQLTSLNFLYLGDNPRAPFAPTAVARPDAGTVLVAGGTVTLDGSGSGGPWGTNVTYRWALTTPASGVRVTFDDATSATPEATIPTLAAGTELTFTLTVTGRGGTDGIETATATARVTATQNITNNPPVFAGGAVQARTFDETIGDATVGAAADIGTPVSATDPDTGDTLTYVLLGADRAKFTFDTSSGQIRTKVGENYDYEARTSYSVMVTVTDGTVTVSSAVTINVTDEDESPPVMNKPVVTATANSTTSLEVSWTEPSNPGRPRIGSYDLQYRVGNTGGFSNGPQDETGSSAAIGNLTADTEYQVRVRATNAEGDGVWSPSGTGNTGRTTITTDPPGVTVSETALTVTEEDPTGESYRVVLDSQPTADVVITVAGHVGTEVTPSPTSLTFTRSNWETGQTVTVTAGSDADTVNDTVTLTHSAASTDSDYNGNSITIDDVTVTVTDDDIDTAAGICGRTEEVRDALLELIPGVIDCAAVTAADLAAITDTLNLSGQNISVLAAGDFAGLTALTELYLNNNGLTTLPKDVFAGLTSLKVLTLYYNELTTLPDGVFGQLTSLNFLYLGDNPRAPFAPTAVARPDAGTVLVAGGTVTLDGSGSGGPWGTNVTYRWALTTPASGVRVTFDDATSATPEATIPTLAAGTELTFTLTVTGRGGTDGIETATATARVTATQNITNNPPVFAGGAVQARTFDETIGDATVGAAADIGTPVSATDPDTGDTLTYVLLGADRAKFTFDTSSGQIRTKVGENYDYEARTSYSVTVAVIDGTVTVSSAVTINVTDEDESPPVMNKPVVTATANSTTSLEVSWTEPSNPGRPRIGSYDLQYRVGSTGGFSNGPQDETGSSAAIGNLTADTEYQVRVRATNAEGDGVWSPSGTGNTGRTTITTDLPGVTVSETALTVTEEDPTGESYRVVLDSQPTADVVVTVVVPSGTEVTPSPTSLTFTRSNWETGQTVTVTAGNDADTVNDTVTLTHGAASTDSDYQGITIASVTVTVTDNDTGNAAPTFDEGGSTTRTFDETIGDTAVTSADIGTPVSATDPDTGDTLEYRLEGTDRAKFTFDTSSGQIRTKVGENYDYEARTSYSVTVTVNDGTVTVSSAVTINVTDQDEPPPVMNQPVVTATANSTTSLEVSWTEPSNPGRPRIDSYDLQYRAGSTGGFSNGPQDETGSSAAIGNLTADTSYEVRVRATNAEGDGVWSPSGTGNTGRTTITTDPPGVTVSETALTVTEEDPTGASYTVVLDSQPTAEVVVTVVVPSGTEVTPSPTSLTFTRSNWETAQTVTVTAGSDADTVNDTVTLTHGAASADSNYQGITIASVTVTVTDDDIDTTAGICGRTEEVRDALLAQIPRVSDCAAVTTADLAAITGPLDLSGQNITALAAGDFAGLTGLIELYLNNNKLTTLRGDVFAGLPALTQLQLNNNELETLPKDVFSGLPVLKVLTLYDNELEKLPDGVFETLTALAYLGLYGNPGAPFAPTAVALPDAGTVPVAGGTVTLDGRGSDGGPWGTNVTYRWALTTPASGVRVTFDDSTSATPEATIPTLAAGTELTFTLTVTGPGGTQGTAPGTDTATVTATDSVTASGDATLGPLRVNDGTRELTLAPAFASGTFASMRRRWATRSRRSR